MSNVIAAHLTGVSLASLLAVGGVQVALAQGYDYRPNQHAHGAMHTGHPYHMGMHRPMHMQGHYAAMHGYHYGMHGGRYYGMHGRYAVGSGIAAAPAIPPQGYDYVGSYGGDVPQQPNYGGSGFGGNGFGLGMGLARPVYVLPDGNLTSSLEDYYSRLGSSSGHQSMGSGRIGALNAETFGALGPQGAPAQPSMGQ
jgi:hypothetical protein